MIKYYLFNEVSDEVIYRTFLEGYSDYQFKVDMDIQTFTARFLENESAREYSFIAFDDEVAVGVMLGNIKNYQGVKTMRCGGFAVIPAYRSQGIGKELFNKHLALAKKLGCKQLYLEVLKDNTEAVKLYKSIGYNPVYDYRMYKAENVNLVDQLDCKIEQTNFAVIKNLRESMPDLHMFWQGEMYVIDKFDNVKNFTITQDNELIAALSIKNTGLINFIWVAPTKRQMGYAKHLLSNAIKTMEKPTLFAIASNNFLYEGFLRHLGFQPEIEQFEMMRAVD